MTNLKEMAPHQLEAYASAIIGNSSGKPGKSNRQKKRDSRPIGKDGRRRRVSRKQQHNN